MTDLALLRDRLRERFPELGVEVLDGIDFPVLVVEPDGLLQVMAMVRDDLGFEMLTDITGVDWLPREPRYDVNYHLLSLSTQTRLRIKVGVADSPEPAVPSVCGLFAGANWPEREVYDFFGISFEGHPDLRRILMPDEWVGHPLRKDYPVGGVPVEYRIEPAYVGDNMVPADARPAAGGVPVRLRRDRGRRSHMTWSGTPASGVEVRHPKPAEHSEAGKEQ